VKAYEAIKSIFEDRLICNDEDIESNRAKLLLQYETFCASLVSTSSSAEGGIGGTLAAAGGATVSTGGSTQCLKAVKAELRKCGFPLLENAKSYCGENGEGKRIGDFCCADVVQAEVGKNSTEMGGGKEGGTTGTNEKEGGVKEGESANKESGEQVDPGAVPDKQGSAPNGMVILLGSVGALVVLGAFNAVFFFVIRRRSSGSSGSSGSSSSDQENGLGSHSTYTRVR
jgi:hypothetical protein